MMPQFRALEPSLNFRSLHPFFDIPGAAELEKAEDSTESIFSGARLPQQFYEDLAKSHNVAALINLTAAQGELEQAMLDLRIPTLSFGCSEKHITALEERLSNYVSREVQRSWAPLLQGRSQQNTGETGDTERERWW